jgi:hypothetical protein
MARLHTFLVIDCPGHPQQVILWDTLEITVGRSPDRDIVIQDNEVSRQHALFRIENQAHTIADLHTSNGTFVNGARVSRHVLRPGDVVELGPARVSFRQEPESPKGKNVKFASQLKGGFAPFPEGEDAGNRTVLGMSGGPGLVMEQGDYSDRLHSNEALFDLGSPRPRRAPPLPHALRPALRRRRSPRPLPLPGCPHRRRRPRPSRRPRGLAPRRPQPASRRRRTPARAPRSPSRSRGRARC